MEFRFQVFVICFFEELDLFPHLRCLVALLFSLKQGDVHAENLIRELFLLDPARLLHNIRVDMYFLRFQERRFRFWLV